MGTLARFGLFLTGLLIVPAAGAKQLAPEAHQGLCNASAAVAVDRDYFVVANDVRLLC